MAGDTKEVRFELNADKHQQLSALSLATDRPMRDLMSDAVDLLIDAHVKKAHEGIRFLRMLGSKGVDSESNRNATP